MPKGADNLTLILDAARILFLERGFGATSMDAVAKHAGVSKATVYAYFSSKDELFAAMVGREGEEQTVSLNADTNARTTMNANAAEVLRRFGRDAAELLLSDSVIAIQRIVASEATRFPAIGELFYNSGPSNLIDGLTTFLQTAMDRGELRAAPARIAAAQFLAIIVGDLQFRALMGLPASGGRNERDAVVASGVDVFLNGYAPQISGKRRR